MLTYFLLLLFLLILQLKISPWTFIFFDFFAIIFNLYLQAIISSSGMGREEGGEEGKGRRGEEEEEGGGGEKGNKGGMTVKQCE